MKIYRILVILLTITLVCSVPETLFDDNTQLIVDGICKQTTDAKFCYEVFANEVYELVNSYPSKTDLMNVTVTEAERFSANTYFFISTLLRNAGDERPNLQMCAEAYAIVNTVFTSAVSFFNQGLYGKIRNLTDNVSTSVGICKTDFIVPGYKINPMIEKNRKTLVLIAMQKIVVHMASS